MQQSRLTLLPVGRPAHSHTTLSEPVSECIPVELRPGDPSQLCLVV
jgi:hypothetical protein